MGMVGFKKKNETTETSKETLGYFYALVCRPFFFPFARILVVVLFCFFLVYYLIFLATVVKKKRNKLTPDRK